MYKWTFKTLSPHIKGANIIDTGTVLAYPLTMTKRTIEQQINEANDRLSRLKARQKKVEVRQQIVLGAALLSVAKMDSDAARALLDLLGKAKLRDAEARDIAPVIAELKAVAGVVEPASTDSGHSGG